MARGSYPVKVTEFSKSVAAVQAAPTTAGAFLNPASNGITIADGQAVPHRAYMPGLDDYEMVEFIFGDQVIPADITAADVTVWERTPSGGVVAVATAELNVGGTLPRIRIPRWAGARYAVTVSKYASSDGTPTVSFVTHIVGRHSATFIEAGTEGN